MLNLTNNASILSQFLFLHSVFLALIITKYLLPTREKSPSFPLDRRFVGPQSWFGNCGEAENVFLFPAIRSRFLCDQALA
jgi:hypothetical protein